MGGRGGRSRSPKSAYSLWRPTHAMRPDKYFWITLSAFFWLLGSYILVDPVRHSGPYAEAYILLGGTFDALGLSAIFFACKRRAEMKALAQHMGRASHYSKGQRREERGNVAERVNAQEQADESRMCEEHTQKVLNEK